MPLSPLHVVGAMRSSGTGASVNVFNPTNASASVHMSWLNDVARLRVGGSGAGGQNGIDFQTTGDASMLRLMHNKSVGMNDANPSSTDVLTLRGLGANSGFLRFRTSDGTDRYHLNYENNVLNFVESGVSANRLVLEPGGNVGIGLADPSAELHIRGNGALGEMIITPTTADTQSQIKLCENSSATFGTILRHDGGANQLRIVGLGTGGEVIHVAVNRDNGRVGIGTVSPGAALDVAGTTRTEVLTITGGSDLSEQFDIASETEVEPGHVVSIDPEQPGRLRLAAASYDRTVAGVISGAGGVRTGMLMGQEGTIADGAHPVALTGRVYVKCDASTGAIAPGDLLTTSTTPGHAMKVLDHERAQGAILGKAMTKLDEGQGLVLVLVTLQ